MSTNVIQCYRVIDPTLASKSVEEQNEFGEAAFDAVTNVHFHNEKTGEYYIVRILPFNDKDLEKLDPNSIEAKDLIDALKNIEAKGD